MAVIPTAPGSDAVVTRAPTYPRAAEGNYARLIRRQLRLLNAFFRDAVKPILARAGVRDKAQEQLDLARGDSWVDHDELDKKWWDSGKVLRFRSRARADVDATYQSEVTVLLGDMRAVWERLSPSADRVEPVADSVERNTARVFTREAKAAGQPASVIALGAEAFTEAEAAAWAETQAVLIEQLGDRYLDELEVITEQAVAEGRSVQEVVKQYQERFNVNQRRADFVARNEIGNLNAELTRQTHQAAGVQSFKWLDSGDERVRELHEQISGQEFSYPEGHPTEGLPGEPFGCRCVPRPVFDSALSADRPRLTTELPATEQRAAG